MTYLHVVTLKNFKIRIESSEYFFGCRLVTHVIDGFALQIGLFKEIVSDNPRVSFKDAI